MTRFLLLSLLLVLLPALVHADEVDVYRGEAVVADQGARERERALPEALRRVLGKYSGLREFGADPALDAALESASAILVSFHYRNVEWMRADGETADELRLVAHFAPSAVDEMARSLGLPLWQARRNPLEVWVVVDNGRARYVLPPEIAYVQGALDRVAAVRGQPLAWPQADEEGMYPVDMQLLWGGYTEDLASPTGVGVLILAARREGVEWSVRANLGFGGGHWAWRIRDLDLEAALVEGLERSVDQIALSSAIAPSELGAWQQELTVAGLGRAADYQHCLAYLQGIGVVDSVTVLSARPAGVTFRLGLNAVPRHLDEVLERQGVLQREESAQGFRYVGVDR